MIAVVNRLSQREHSGLGVIAEDCKYEKRNLSEPDRFGHAKLLTDSNESDEKSDGQGVEDAVVDLSQRKALGSATEVSGIDCEVLAIQRLCLLCLSE